MKKSNSIVSSSLAFFLSSIVPILLLSVLYFDPLCLDGAIIPRFTLLGIGLSFSMLWVMLTNSTYMISQSLLSKVLISITILHFVSIFWAVNAMEALFVSTKAFLGLMVFVQFYFLWTAREKEMREKVFWVFPLISLVVLLVVADQMRSVRQMYGVLDANSAYLVTGLSSNKNELSSFLMLLIPLNLISAIHAKGRIRYLPLVLAALCLLAIIILQTRTVYMALFAGLIFYIAWQLMRNRNIELQALIRYVLYPVLGLVILLLLAALLSGSGLELVERFDISRYTGSKSAIERYYLWQKSWFLFKEHPILGVGAGNWKLAFPSVGLDGLTRMQDYHYLFIRPHNDYLLVLDELGVVGFVLFVMVFLLGISYSVSIRNAELASIRFEALLIGVTVVSFAVVSFFDFPRERMEHSILWYFILARLAVLYDMEQDRKPIDVPGMLRFPLLALLVFTVVIGVFRWKGERKTISFIEMPEQTVENRQMKKLASLDAENFFYKLDPTGVPIKWYTGMMAYTLGEHTEAIEYFKSAYRSNPYNYHVVHNLGTAYVLVEEYDLAIKEYLESLRINPRFEEARFNIAAAYADKGDLDSAMIWLNTVEVDTMRQSEYLNLLEEAGGSSDP